MISTYHFVPSKKEYKRYYREHYWITSNLEPIKIGDMSNLHLKYSIRKIEVKSSSLGVDPSKYIVYNNLCNELKRREVYNHES